MIQEPPAVTLAWAGLWAVVCITGIVALVHPPAAVEHEAGTVLTTVWACCLTMGGALGVVGAIPGWWWVERAGIIAAGSGLLVYVGTTTILVVEGESPGAWAFHTGMAMIAFTSFAARWIRIWGAQLDPARGVTT